MFEVRPASTPRIVGILNVTEDSFSDGGRFLNPVDALAHATRLMEGGAEVVEIGAASSHPDARAVPADEELRRLESVIQVLDKSSVGVDTFEQRTQLAMLARGIKWVNDINGFPDPQVYGALADSAATLVVMHSVQGRGKATRDTSAGNAEQIHDRINRFFDSRLIELERAGVARERIIIDPGLGHFLSADPRPSLLVLARIGELRSRFGLPVLISPSRKSFLRKIVNSTIEGSGPATLAAEIFSAVEGVDYIRTHDPSALRDSLKILGAITQARTVAM